MGGSSRVLNLSGIPTAQLRYLIAIGRENAFDEMMLLALDVAVEAARSANAYDHWAVSSTVSNYLALSAKLMQDEGAKPTPVFTRQLAMHENVFYLVQLVLAMMRTLTLPTTLAPDEVTPDDVEQLQRRRDRFVESVLRVEPQNSVETIVYAAPLIFRCDRSLFRVLQELCMMDTKEPAAVVATGVPNQMLSISSLSQSMAYVTNATMTGTGVAGSLLSPGGGTSSLPRKTPNASFQAASITSGGGGAFSPSVSVALVEFGGSATGASGAGGGSGARKTSRATSPTPAPVKSENFAKSFFKSFFGGSGGGGRHIHQHLHGDSDDDVSTKSEVSGTVVGPASSVGGTGGASGAHEGSVDPDDADNEGRPRWLEVPSYVEFVRQFLGVLNHLYGDDQLHIEVRMAAGLMLPNVVFSDAVTFEMFEGRATLRSFLHVLQEQVQVFVKPPRIATVASGKTLSGSTRVGSVSVVSPRSADSGAGGGGGEVQQTPPREKSRSSSLPDGAVVPVAIGEAAPLPTILVASSSSGGPAGSPGERARNGSNLSPNAVTFPPASVGTLQLPEFLGFVNKAISALERAYHVIGVPPLTSEAVSLTELPLFFFCADGVSTVGMALERCFTRVVSLWAIAIAGAECDEDMDRRSMEVLLALFQRMIGRGSMPKDSVGVAAGGGPAMGNGVVAAGSAVAGASGGLSGAAASSSATHGAVGPRRSVFVGGGASMAGDGMRGVLGGGGGSPGGALVSSPPPGAGMTAGGAGGLTLRGRGSGSSTPEGNNSLFGNGSYFNLTAVAVTDQSIAEYTNTVEALSSVFKTLLRRCPSLLHSDGLAMLLALFSSHDSSLARLGRECVICSFDSPEVYASYAHIIEEGEGVLLAQVLPLLARYLSAEELSEEARHERRVWLMDQGCISAAIGVIVRCLSNPHSTPGFVRLVPHLFRLLSAFEPAQLSSPQLSETNFVPVVSESLGHMEGVEYYIIVAQAILDAATGNRGVDRMSGGYAVSVVGSFHISQVNAAAEKTVFLDLVPALARHVRTRDVELYTNLIEVVRHILKCTSNVRSELLIDFALDEKLSQLLPYLELPQDSLCRLPFTGTPQAMREFWIPILLHAPLRSEIRFTATGGVTISIGTWPEHGLTLSAVFRFDEVYATVPLFEFISLENPTTAANPAAIVVAGGDSVQLSYDNRRVTINESHALQSFAANKWMNMTVVLGVSRTLTMFISGYQVGSCTMPYFTPGSEATVHVGFVERVVPDALYSLGEITLWDTELTAAQVAADVAATSARKDPTKILPREVPRTLSAPSSSPPIDTRIARYVPFENEGQLLVNVLGGPAVDARYPLLAKIVGRHSVPPKSWVDFHLLWASRGGVMHMLDWLLEDVNTPEQMEEVLRVVAETTRRTVVVTTIDARMYLLLNFVLKASANLITPTACDHLLFLATSQITINDEEHRIIINRLAFEHLFSDSSLYAAMPLPAALYLLTKVQRLFSNSVCRHAKHNAHFIQPFRFVDRMLNSLISVAASTPLPLHTAIIGCAKQVVVASDMEEQILHVLTSAAALLTPIETLATSHRNHMIRVTLPAPVVTGNGAQTIPLPTRVSAQMSVSVLRALTECTSSTLFASGFAHVIDVQWYAECIGRFADPVAVIYATRMFFDAMQFSPALKEAVVQNQSAIIDLLQVHAANEDLLLLLLSITLGASRMVDMLSERHTLLQQLDGILGSFSPEPNTVVAPIFVKLFVLHLHSVIHHPRAQQFRLNSVVDRQRRRSSRVFRYFFLARLCCRLMLLFRLRRYRVAAARRMAEVQATNTTAPTASQAAAQQVINRSFGLLTAMKGVQSLVSGSTAGGTGLSNEFDLSTYARSVAAEPTTTTTPAVAGVAGAEDRNASSALRLEASGTGSALVNMSFASNVSASAAPARRPSDPQTYTVPPPSSAQARLRVRSSKYRRAFAALRVCVLLFIPMQVKRYAWVFKPVAMSTDSLFAKRHAGTAFLLRSLHRFASLPSLFYVFVTSPIQTAAFSALASYISRERLEQAIASWDAYTAKLTPTPLHECLHLLPQTDPSVSDLSFATQSTAMGQPSPTAHGKEGSAPPSTTSAMKLNVPPALTVTTAVTTSPPSATQLGLTTPNPAADLVKSFGSTSGSSASGMVSPRPMASLVLSDGGDLLSPRSMVSPPPPPSQPRRQGAVVAGSADAEAMPPSAAGPPSALMSRAGTSWLGEDGAGGGGGGGPPSVESTAVPLHRIAAAAAAINAAVKAHTGEEAKGSTPTPSLMIQITGPAEPHDGTVESAKASPAATATATATPSTVRALDVASLAIRQGHTPSPSTSHAVATEEQLFSSDVLTTPTPSSSRPDRAGHPPLAVDELSSSSSSSPAQSPSHTDLPIPLGIVSSAPGSAAAAMLHAPCFGGEALSAAPTLTTSGNSSLALHPTTVSQGYESDDSDLSTPPSRSLEAHSTERMMDVDTVTAAQATTTTPAAQWEDRVSAVGATAAALTQSMIDTAPLVLSSSCTAAGATSVVGEKSGDSSASSTAEPTPFSTLRASNAAAYVDNLSTVVETVGESMRREAVGMLAALIESALNILPMQRWMGGASYGACGGLLFQMLLITSTTAPGDDAGSTLIRFFLYTVAKKVCEQQDTVHVPAADDDAAMAAATGGTAGASAAAAAAAGGPVVNNSIGDSHGFSFADTGRGSFTSLPNSFAPTRGAAASDVFLFNVSHFTELVADMLSMNVIDLPTANSYFMSLLTSCQNWPARYVDQLSRQIMRSCVSVLNKPSMHDTSVQLIETIYTLTRLVIRPGWFMKGCIECLFRVLYRAYVSLPPVWLSESDALYRKKIIALTLRHIVRTYYKTKELQKALTVRTLTQRFSLYDAFCTVFMREDDDEACAAFQLYVDENATTIDTLMAGRPKAKADLALKANIKIRNEYIKRIKAFNGSFVAATEVREGWHPAEMRAIYAARFSSYTAIAPVLDESQLHWLTGNNCVQDGREGMTSRLYHCLDSQRNYATVEVSTRRADGVSSDDVLRTTLCEEQVNHVAVLVPPFLLRCAPIITMDGAVPTFIGAHVKLSPSAVTMLRYLLEPNAVLRFISNGFRISGIHATPCLILLTNNTLKVISFSRLTQNGDIVLCEYDDGDDEDGHSRVSDHVSMDEAPAPVSPGSGSSPMKQKRHSAFSLSNMTKQIQRLLTDDRDRKKKQLLRDGSRVAQSVRQSTSTTYRHLFWTYIVEGMREVRCVRYMHMDTAVLLSMNHDDGPMLSFVDETQSMNPAARAQFLQVLKEVVKPLRCTFVDDAQRSGSLRSMLVRWAAGSVSTFDYLQFLNRVAGRSYKDFNQYPVFPWVLADYSSRTLDLEHPDTFREFALPMGAQTETRRNAVSVLYENMAEVEDPDTSRSYPFHHGTHYSTSGGVLYFLIRVEPFTTFAKIFQGGDFDLAARLFDSVEASFNSCVVGPADCKELVPEFYFNGMFLLNADHLNLGVKEDGNPVDSVRLPPWAKGSVQVFTSIMRYALESEYVLHHIHQWIDLVFGVRRRGPLAVEAYNCFQRMTYGEEVSKALKEADTPHDCDVIIAEVDNFGQTPVQLFQERHPALRELEPVRAAVPVSSGSFVPSLANVVSAGGGLTGSSVSMGSGHTYTTTFEREGPKVMKMLVHAHDEPQLFFRLEEPNTSQVLHLLPGNLFEQFNQQHTAVRGFARMRSTGKIALCYAHLIPVDDEDYVLSWYSRESRLMRFSASQPGEYRSTLTFDTPDESCLRIQAVAVGTRESLVLVAVSSGTIYCLYPDSEDRFVFLNATLCRHTNPVVGFALDHSFGRAISFTTSGADFPVVWRVQRFNSSMLHRLDVAALLPNESDGDRIVVGACIDHASAFSVLITRRQLLLFDINGFPFGVGTLPSPRAHPDAMVLEDENGDIGVAVDRPVPFVANMTVVEVYRTTEWASGMQLFVTGHQDGTVALWRSTRLPPDTVAPGRIAVVEFHAVLFAGSGGSGGLAGDGASSGLGAVTALWQDRPDVPHFFVGYASGAVRTLTFEEPPPQEVVKGGKKEQTQKQQ